MKFRYLSFVLQAYVQLLGEKLKLYYYNCMYYYRLIKLNTHFDSYIIYKSIFQKRCCCIRVT